MITKPINSGNRKFCLYITIKCREKGAFRCIASDHGKKNSKYADRTIVVNGTRTIYFSFPITPKVLMLTVCNVHNPNDKSFEVTLEEKPLQDYAIWMDEETRDFSRLGLYFAQVAGFPTLDGIPTALPQGRIFKTGDSQFTIKYYPIIKDVMTGRPMSTPARIGHSSGIIDISQKRFVPYTIPMRFCIECHEFSHKYRNPKMGLPIENETGADINGLYIYLGLGFSKIDAIYVYANVFLKAQTPGNINRMRKIMDYIQRFENQEFAKIA